MNHWVINDVELFLVRYCQLSWVNHLDTNFDDDGGGDETSANWTNEQWHFDPVNSDFDH